MWFLGAETCCNGLHKIRGRMLVPALQLVVVDLGFHHCNELQLRVGVGSDCSLGLAPPATPGWLLCPRAR